jgi:acyl-CoA synthetase (AMP-forming)/AMP-acid ligase II
MVNVAARLTRVALDTPDAIAVVEPLGYDRRGHRRYRHLTFRQLDDDSNHIAAGLRQWGVTPGTKMALLVPPGIDFLSLVFALFKAGVVAILIDPGMGRHNMVACLAEADPEGFIAIPLAHIFRVLCRRRFPRARWNATVGHRWFWGGTTLSQLRNRGQNYLSNRAAPFSVSATQAQDPAAIVFTTGSTGPAKGVLYRHGNFDAQADEIRTFYNIQPGEIDLSCFPLFALFNCAMGTTAVIPDMDPSRPGRVDPAKIVEAAHDWKVTQAFGSPAIWNRVGPYCAEHNIRLPSLRRVLSAGAPVPVHVLGRMMACIHPEGDMHTPYGATEALPVASIAATEVLSETAAQTRQGAGVCVGRRFPGIQWHVVRIVDGPIRTLTDAEVLPPGEIGELIVRGPVVTREYVTRTEANALGKIADGDRVWHRMGDVGYLDDRERFWFCGRLAHRVLTAEGPLYTIPCEAIFNEHPQVFRSALVGVGPAGQQRPVMIVEPRPGQLPQTAQDHAAWIEQLRQIGGNHALTRRIETFLVHPSFPVDIRHNAKISREKLAVWAGEELR